MICPNTSMPNILYGFISSCLVCAFFGMIMEIFSCSFLQKQSRIGLKSEKYCPRGKIMFSRYPDLCCYDMM